MFLFTFIALAWIAKCLMNFTGVSYVHKINQPVFVQYLVIFPALGLALWGINKAFLL